VFAGIPGSITAHSKNEIDNNIVMTSIDHPYYYVPFAGVLCIICMYRLNTTFSLENEIHRHEKYSGKHEIHHNATSRQVIIQLIEKQLSAMIEAIIGFTKAETIEYLSIIPLYGSRMR
jgi:hypothetical protein